MITALISTTGITQVTDCAGERTLDETSRAIDRKGNTFLDHDCDQVFDRVILILVIQPHGGGCAVKDGSTARLEYDKVTISY